MAPGLAAILAQPSAETVAAYALFRRDPVTGVPPVPNHMERTFTLLFPPAHTGPFKYRLAKDRKTTNAAIDRREAAARSDAVEGPRRIAG